MADQTADNASTQVEKTETPSLDERMTKTAERLIGEAAAAESASATTTEGHTEAPAEAKADEKPNETTEAKPDAITPEQLADPKFWGQLDKPGWERMERDFPVATRHVKAAQAAATKIVNAARQTTPKPAEERTETQTQQKQSLTPELQEAWRKKNSFDPAEALEGEREWNKLILRESLPEFGFDPAAHQAHAIATSAYAAAIEVLPDLKQFSDAELDAAVESDPALMRMLSVADKLPDNASRVEMIAGVMIKAGQTLTAQKQSATAKQAAAEAAKNETTKLKQAKERSNANVASSAVAETSASGAPRKKPSMEERAAEMWNEAAQTAR
jgi:hypothetical protein